MDCFLFINGIIKNNPKITIETLANELLLSVRGVEYHIRKLKGDKIIVRKGGRKDGYWEIKENER
ncbi:MAG: winged helix-turn-helix transcriptional regulator [Bacteroidota bacterium]|nr:winged helix-turn-helix transcriptional regulator [Bacteroidota bacterium]